MKGNKVLRRVLSGWMTVDEEVMEITKEVKGEVLVMMVELNDIE